jgi:hypothetical protein
MPKPRFGRSARALNGRVRFDAGQLPYESVFVITFQTMSPGPKNRLESRVSRFSTICAKNLLLKLKIDKVTVNRVEQITLSSGPPLYYRTTYSSTLLTAVFDLDLGPKFSTRVLSTVVLLI